MSTYFVRGHCYSLMTLVIIAVANPIPLLGQSRYGSGSGRSGGSGNQMGSSQRQMAQAAAQLKQAHTKFRIESKQLLLTRMDVQKEHSQDAAFVAARQQWDESRKEFAGAKNSIVDKLKSYTPEYKAAIKERDTIKRQMNDSDYYEEERVGLMRKYAAAISLIARLEKEAVYSNDEGAALQKQVNDHDSIYRDLVKKREIDINNDSRLISAKASIKSAKAALNMAQRQYDMAQMRLASAQRQMGSNGNHNRNHRRN